MFTQLKKRNEGFTIVELLIVIVVIGILAVLVLNTFQGVQGRARDTERKTDINAIHTQLEVFYNDNGYYLALPADINATNLPGLSDDAIEDPDKDGVGTTGDAVDYIYNALPDGCDNATDATECGGYTLEAVLEEEDTNYNKNSLNNP